MYFLSNAAFCPSNRLHNGEFAGSNQGLRLHPQCLSSEEREEDRLFQCRFTARRWEQESDRFSAAAARPLCHSRESQVSWVWRALQRLWVLCDEEYLLFIFYNACFCRTPVKLVKVVLRPSISRNNKMQINVYIHIHIFHPLRFTLQIQQRPWREGQGCGASRPSRGQRKHRKCCKTEGIIIIIHYEWSTVCFKL